MLCILPGHLLITGDDLAREGTADLPVFLHLRPAPSQLQGGVRPTETVIRPQGRPRTTDLS